MTEKTITVSDTIDISELYGPANTHINRIKEKFPQLRITARGRSIILVGGAEPVERFEARWNQLQDYVRRYRHVSDQVIDQIFDANAFEKNRDHANGIATPVIEEAADIIVSGNDGNIVRARTPNQRRLVELYAKNDLIFAVGPAGSGKTYTAIALAVRALRNKEVKRIILTRPAVEAGERLGFLPGDLKEKLDPYLQPLYDALNDMIPPRRLAEYLESGIVQIAPLAYMRGRTLDNAFVILDEAQNTLLSQIRMFLTRMGRNAKFIVTGDTTQIDLPYRSDSGLVPAMEKLRGIEGVGIVEFDSRDIMRHQLVQHIVKAFESDSDSIMNGGGTAKPSTKARAGADKTTTEIRTVAGEPALKVTPPAAKTSKKSIPKIEQ